MKKVMISAIALMISSMSLTTVSATGFGGIRVVTMHNGDDKDDKGNENPSTGGPLVVYDNLRVTLTSDSEPINATITITGTKGNVMYCGQQTITPGGSTISVPDNADEKKSVIEVVTDYQRLHGYFK